jgi:hypothetical protein
LPTGFAILGAGLLELRTKKPDGGNSVFAIGFAFAILSIVVWGVIRAYIAMKNCSVSSDTMHKNAWISYLVSAQSFPRSPS